MMKNYYYKDGKLNSDIANLVFGGLAGCMAVSVTYPTDLIRRRLQISVIIDIRINIRFLILVQKQLTLRLSKIS